MSKKKPIAAFALAALFALNAAPAFAADVSTGNTVYTIDYSEIEQTVLSYNLQVSSNEQNLSNLDDENELKKKYEELSDTLAQASSSLAAIQNDPNLDSSEASKDLKAVAKGTQLSLSSLSAALEAQEDVSDDDYKLTDLQADSANYQLVRTAQSMFSVYYQLQYNLENLQNSRVLLMNTEKAAQAQYELNQGTALAVSQAKDAVAAADNSIADLQNQSEAVGSQINRLLGHAYSDKITFGSMPQPDTAYAGKINLTDDVTAAQTASYAVQIDRQKLAILSDDTREERDERRAMQDQISLEIQNAGAAVQKQYDTVQKQEAVLTAEQTKLSTAKRAQTQAQAKYAAGLISSMEYDTARNSELAQQLVVKTASSKLFGEIEEYKWIVKGLPAAD